MWPAPSAPCGIWPINNATYPEYDYTSLLVDPLQPATSAWKTRGDVKVWWNNGASGNLGGPIGKGDLGPPFQGANASGSVRNTPSARSSATTTPPMMS